MESVTFTAEHREKLCKHVADKGGWPGGFGISGTRIAHEAAADNIKGFVTLTSDELGDLWPKLLALATEAGVSAPVVATIDEPAPEAPPVEAFPTITLDHPPTTVPGTGG